MNMTFAVGITVSFERQSGSNGQGLQCDYNVIEVVTFRYRLIFVIGEIILRYLLRSHILRACFAPYIFGIL